MPKTRCILLHFDGIQESDLSRLRHQSRHLTNAAVRMQQGRSLTGCSNQPRNDLAASVNGVALQWRRNYVTALSLSHNRNQMTSGVKDRVAISAESLCWSFGFHAMGKSSLVPLSRQQNIDSRRGKKFDFIRLRNSVCRFIVMRTCSNIEHLRRLFRQRKICLRIDSLAAHKGR